MKTPYLKPPTPCLCDFCNRHRFGFSKWDLYNWPAYDAIMTDLREHFKLLSYGKDRVTFEHKGFVIKVPRHDMGYLANLSEYKLYRKYGKKRGYARCRMWGDALVMERVKCARTKCLPAWTHRIDNQQVGYDEKGRLVAYDYGG